MPCRAPTAWGIIIVLFRLSCCYGHGKPKSHLELESDELPSPSSCMVDAAVWSVFRIEHFLIEIMKKKQPKALAKVISTLWCITAVFPFVLVGSIALLLISSTGRWFWISKAFPSQKLPMGSFSDGHVKCTLWNCETFQLVCQVISEHVPTL